MCYVFPLTGAVISHSVWGKTKSAKVWWLTLMFYGAAFFGVIDHCWNKELFLIPENFTSDLLLGLSISVAILLVWAVMLKVSKTHPTLSGYLNINS